MFRSLSEGELAARGALLIENVQDGFLRFEAVTLRGDKLAMQCFLERCLVVNEGASFADFYYSVLTEEEQRGFVAGLSDEEKSVFLLPSRISKRNSGAASGIDRIYSAKA